MHLSFLAFGHICALFRELFHEIVNQHYTLLTISPILFIFYSARNLMRNFPYRPLWRFMKIPIVWWERRNVRWEKWLARRFTKCHLYTFHLSRFANIFAHSRQFDDKCIAGLKFCKKREKTVLFLHWWRYLTEFHITRVSIFCKP